MPIYEYRCRRCDTEFERYVPAAGTAVACPGCASPEVNRKLSVFGLRTDAGFVPSAAPAGGCCGGGGCGCH